MNYNYINSMNKLIIERFSVAGIGTQDRQRRRPVQLDGPAAAGRPQSRPGQ